MSRLKKLFSDYVNDKSTKTEKEIVDLWYDNKSMREDNFTTDEDAEEFELKAWSSFEKRLKKNYLKNNWSLFFKYTGVVASAVIFIVIVLQFSYKFDITGTKTPTKIEDVISNQFVSNKSIKIITLPDGSIIHMNMGTTISMYEGKFNSFQREVWLDEGEAFFEVVKDSDRPFIVHTADGLTTRVLGTSFNIKAHKELGEQVVSVKTGRVQVKRGSDESRILELDNKLVYNSETKEISTAMTSGADAADWRTGRIVLDHVKIKELAFRLKQYYDVELINKSIGDEMEIYTSFDTNTSLEHIMNNIGSMFGVNTKIENNRVYIY